MTFIEFEPMINFHNENTEKFVNEYEQSSYSISPKIDISEDEKNFYIDTEIPGIEKEDIKLTLHEDKLIISGEKKNPFTGNNERRVISNERNYGKFEKTFTINSEIVTDKILANFENGILSIKIEKKIPEKRERIIDIK